MTGLVLVRNNNPEVPFLGFQATDAVDLIPVSLGKINKIEKSQPSIST